MTTAYAQVKDLPQSLQNALAGFRYGKVDITLTAKETYTLIDGGSDGRRAFTCAVNLTTGETQTTWGSWGGGNMFNPSNQVDLDDTARPIPQGFAIIKGSQGGQVYASIYLNPANMVELLPSATALTPAEQSILGQMLRLKPAYRTFRKDSAEFLGLVERGLVKVNKGGAAQITTDGKNALQASGYKGY